jgi:oligosaccharide repeat unit polymerase
MCLVFAKTKKQRALCSSWLIPSIFFSFINAARANSLMCIVFVGSGYLATRLAVLRERKKFSVKRLIPYGVALLVLVSFWLGIDAVRSHTEESDIDTSEIRARLKAYTLGYLPTFSYWVDRREDILVEPGRPTLGAYTFGGIFDSLGIQQRKPGVYQEFVQLGDWIGEPDQISNLYTTFRSVIEDFSLTGAVLFLGLFGFLSGWSYRRAKAGSTLWIPLLALCYAFWLWSPLGSLFTYNGAVVAAIVPIMTIWCFDEKRRMRRESRTRNRPRQSQTSS